jgi:hypothetical protein
MRGLPRIQTGGIMRSRRVGVVMALTFLVAGCGGSDSSTGASAPAPDDSASSAAVAKEAVAGFVAGVRAGDGASACGFLAEAEQKLFVINAGDVRPKLATESCASVVKSFHAANVKSADQLDGSLENVSVSDDFVSANWVWSAGNGEQAVLLEKIGGAWLIGESDNDFPTAVLHFFDPQ